jgi:hypothetical protein
LHFTNKNAPSRVQIITSPAGTFALEIRFVSLGDHYDVYPTIDEVSEIVPRATIAVPSRSIPAQIISLIVRKNDKTERKLRGDSI